MPFKIACSCGVALLAGDDLSNQKVACPECGGYTLLPDIPDPYKLPTNAEMMPLEEPRKGNDSSTKFRTNATRRKTVNNRDISRQQGPKEMSTTEIVLIIGLVTVGVVIFVVLLAYFVV